MKITCNRPIFALLSLVLVVLVTASCQREVNIDLDKGLSSQIQQIVPQAILDSLRKNGFIINEGLVPPQLSGIYFLDKTIMQVSYGPEDSYKPGAVFSSYYYQFYGQDAAGAIKFDYSTSDKSDKGTGRGAFISGNGNKFTIFSEQAGVTGGISNKQLTVISGELTPTGIQGWQNSFVLTEKTGDSPTSPKLVPVGKGRIFKDGDGLAVKTTYYPQSVKPSPETGLQLVTGTPDPPTMSAAQ